MSGSMSHIHRTTLIQFGNQSHPPLNLDPILSYLECHQILPEKKIDEIRRSGRFSRLDLMRALTKQGSHAFDSLYMALVHSQQVHLGESLRPLVDPSTLSTIENNCQLNGINRLSASDANTIGVSLLDTRNSFSSLNVRDDSIAYFEKYKHEIYPNNTSPRGHVLIISNEYFYQMPQRKGTSKDANDLYDLFKSLDYEVKQHVNLSSKEMRHCVSEFASSRCHESTSSAFLCILTHGEPDGLLGTDDVPVQTIEIISRFNAFNAPYLAGKPKILLFQACRGDRKDRGYDETDSGPHFLNCLGGNVQTRSRSAVEADILIGYATPPFHVSWRNSERGSWFIQSFIEIVRKRSKDSDLLSMLTLVNEKVSSSYEAQSDRFKQIPEHHSRLTKKFYFSTP